MKEYKDYDDLIDKYPKLYSYCRCFECGPGWYYLIDELSSKLEALITEMDLPEEEACRATQVKEKYGSLRFYMSTMIDEMDELIEEAENKSFETCESCGDMADEENRIGTWYYTRCKKCLEKLKQGKS